MTDYQPHEDIYRAAHRDPVEAVLTWLWLIGHLIVLALLGVVADHRPSSDRFGPILAADHEPDRGPEQHPAVEPEA
ncbi:hypothetical protein [Kitasatospora sp. MBT66]|uniref:hypothetical protein n=1 Tax=Kitasatospora sp. MBT66 TaxID=1444769 RepID=UPI0005B8E515|nr:hypothetical protein [Kitasatospora sp. MBT66]